MNLFSKLSKEQLEILFKVYLLDIESKKMTSKFNLGDYK